MQSRPDTSDGVRWRRPLRREGFGLQGRFGRERLSSAWNTERYTWALRTPIHPRKVLYEAYSGRDITCHPEAIFQHLLRSPDMAHLKHVWALTDEDRIAAARHQYADVPNVDFVVYGGAAYQRALATAKYLVNNVTFPRRFSKRPGQIFVNTWHRHPAQGNGPRYPGAALRSAQYPAQLPGCRLLHRGERVQRRTDVPRRLQNAKHLNGQIVVEGSPRTDRQILGDTERAAVLQQLTDAGIEVGNRRIVLYAPTWRGANYFRANRRPGAVDQEPSTTSAPRSTQERFLVLLKPHQVVSDALASSGVLPGQLVAELDAPTNPLLGITDLLISDYSASRGFPGDRPAAGLPRP